MSSKPKITKKCVANNYAAPGETISEFVFPSGKGGLISLIQANDGKTIIELYQMDAGIEIRASGHTVTTPERH